MNNAMLKTSDETERMFYEAFRHCDKQMMSQLWAKGDVLCIHPSSGSIVGHDAVIRSWAHIFSDGGIPDIKASVRQRIVSRDLAVHVVAEEVAANDETVLVIATNVYKRIDNRWLMVEHHASLVPSLTNGQTLQ